MEIVVRASCLYFFLWLVARGIGKRELSEMTAFELILLVTMGDLIQQGVTQEDFSMTGAFLAVGTFALWILVFGYVSWKFPRTRPAIEGVPVVVLRDGRPLDEVLEIERLTVGELCESARNQGIKDLAEVRVGILEPDGKFSFIRVGDAEDGAARPREAQGLTGPQGAHARVASRPRKAATRSTSASRRRRWEGSRVVVGSTVIWSRRAVVFRHQRPPTTPSTSTTDTPTTCSSRPFGSRAMRCLAAGGTSRSRWRWPRT